MKRTHQSGAQKRREKQRKIDEASKSTQKMAEWLSKTGTSDMEKRGTFSSLTFNG